MILKFSDNLKNLLLQNNKTQQQLADFLNTTQQTISRWIKGSNQPDFYNLLKMADYFDCSVDYLLGTDTVPAKGSEPEVNLDSNTTMFYNLGSIPELYMANITDLVYEYKLTQKYTAEDPRPITFDASEYRILIAIVLNRKNNQRNLIVRYYKYDDTDTVNKYKEVEHIEFKNIYNLKR